MRRLESHLKVRHQYLTYLQLQPKSLSSLHDQRQHLNQLNAATLHQQIENLTQHPKVRRRYSLEKSLLALGELRDRPLHQRPEEDKNRS